MNKIIITLAIAAAISTPNARATECNDEFAAKFKEYFIAKNLDGILSLYNMQGVDNFIKESLEKHIKRHFDNTIETIAIEAFKNDFPLTFELNGKKYKANTKPTRELKIRFKSLEAKKDSSVTTDMSFYLGLDNGDCRIVTSAPIQDR